MLASLSKYAKDFIDAADENGNIRNNRTNLMYVAAIDSAINHVGRDKFKAVYPFIGGTAFSHKFNFMNPSDSDSAFRISWSGSLTHSSMGVKGDGLSGYGNTYFNPSTDLVFGDAHLSFYAGDNPTQGGNLTDIGTDDSFRLITRRQKDNRGFIFIANNTSIDNQTIVVNDARGFSIANCISNSLSLIKNTQKVIPEATGSTSFIGYDNNLVQLLARRSTVTSVVDEFSSKLCQFASIGNGLREIEAFTFSHNITVAQRSIGRGV